MGLISDVLDFTGVGALLGWLTPEPPKQKLPGAELTSAETDANISKIYGTVQKHAGTIVFKETNDVDDDDIKNDLLHIIVVWGERVQSIDEVYLDDIPYSSDDDAFYHDDGGKVVYVINFPNGMAGYDAPILARSGWRDSDKLEGKACSYIRLEYHGGETAINSEPNLTADITGTTFSNPATALKDYLTNSIYGKGLPTSLLNLPSFTYAEALCNADVEEQQDGGVMRDLFTCNIALDTGNTVLENVNKLLKPMRGWLPIVDGKLKLIIEEDSAPVDLPIYEEDILQMGKIKEGNKNSRYNRVSVTYREPSADGTNQEAVYPEKNSSIYDALIEEDNGFPAETSVDLETCRNYYEALEFAKTYLEVSRQQLRTTITLPKWATIYEVGDIVPVYHSFPGWAGKLFRIESIEENREEVTLSVREHQPYIYDFFGLGNKPELPDTSYVPGTPDAPTDLDVTHIYSNFVQVRVSWVSLAQRFDYRVLKGSVIVKTERIAANSVELSGFDLGEYRFQVRALSGLGKRSGWAEIALVMQEPGIPTSVEIVAEDLELEVIPYLAGSDSSTAFKYSISYDVEDTEPPTPHRGPAHTYTFTGLAPNTQYKIWVSSFNALGQSEWISVLGTTTNDLSQWAAIVRSVEIPGLPENLGDTISGIVDDVSYWSAQSSDLGEDYSTLIYNVTQVEAANQVNSLNILAVQQKVGDSSVQAQIAEFKNTQIGYEDQNGDWIEGAAFAQAFDEIKINNLNGEELSVFSYFQALENAIGDIEGEIQFAIDANGRMTGVFIRGSQTVSEIIFLATNTYWVNSEGFVVLGVNTSTNELEFHGGGTFTGKLVSPEFQTIGTNFMKVENADGFGPDSLWYWYGPKIVDGNNEPILAQLTKSNALEWKDTTGDSYFGGTLSAGMISNSARSTVATENPSVTVGPFTTNGNSKVVAFSFSYSAISTYEGECPFTAPTPSCTVTLERKVGEGSFQPILSYPVTGQVSQFYAPEFGGCTTNESMSGSWTYTDSNSETGVFTYRVVVSDTVRYHGANDVDYQTVSLISTEE